jgi:WD40 repeat protein
MAAVGCGQPATGPKIAHGAGQRATSKPIEMVREGPPPREGPQYWVGEAAFSPDNRFLLTAYDFDGKEKERHVFPKTASLWDVSTGRECWSLKAGELNVIGFAFMPDGKQILITDDDGVKVVDASNGKLIRSFAKNKKPIRCVAVSPDGKLALTGDMGNATIGSDLVLWDVASGQPIQVLQTGNFQEVAFSKDGKLMLAAARSRPGINAMVWNVAKRELLVALNSSEGWGAPAALSPDATLGAAGKRLEPTSEGALVLWEATTGKAVQTLHEDFPSAVAFTSDSKGILTGNPEKGRLALWDISTGKEVWTATPGSIQYCTFSADGSLAFTTVGKFIDKRELRKHLTIWDAASGQRLRSLGDREQ